MKFVNSVVRAPLKYYLWVSETIFEYIRLSDETDTSRSGLRRWLGFIKVTKDICAHMNLLIMVLCKE